ncbi:stromal interaction molecule homolog [Pollicipes pollicipes]|uniref:stromal interaction molecule homolog n=1 Tax=Pollicipes pollicipes TaxID=41117 RepID=UPI0018852837|nr:stromal interaction molecule homolog [Pollicipes pollicipes]
MAGYRLLLLLPLLLLGLLLTAALAGAPSTAPERGSGEAEEDLLSYDAISSLHLQLDDDADGQIDKAESDEFLREELNYVQGYGSRQDLFHRSDQSQDTAVSVRELWEHWRRSAVHNWTTEQTVEWLVLHVHLPQYREVFELHHIAGPSLPRLAVNNNHFLSGVLGIKDPRHKQKIMLKAMDAVLFGPPKDPSNLVKDAILLTLVLVASVGCWLVYRQNQKFQLRMRKMTADMESLSKAEETLLVELDRANQEKEVVSSHNRRLEQRLTGDVSADGGQSELERLRSEVEMLTETLRSTEAELEDRCWNCPPALQHWLQLTYELELRDHSRKRADAERQLEDAKVMCDKLRKKQNSLYGALVSTHGRTVNDVDTSIVLARKALMEVTQELQERTYRWRQIELICGFQVVHNPGLPYLESLTRTLQRNTTSIPRTASSLRKSDDDLDEDSVSTHGQSATSSTAVSALAERASASRLLERDSSQSSYDPSTRPLERDSSQSSHESARLLERDSSQSSHGSAPDGESRPAGSIAAFADSLRPSALHRVTGGQRSPALRRGNMVKSHSHDAAVPAPAKEAELQTASRLVSRSDSALDSAPPSQLGSRLRQIASNTPTVDEEDGTDSSSVTEDGDRKPSV